MELGYHPIAIGTGSGPEWMVGTRVSKAGSEGTGLEFRRDG